MTVLLMMARPQSACCGAHTDHSPTRHDGSGSTQVARCSVAPHSRPPADPSSITSLLENNLNARILFSK